jgi:hypothetical protein
MLNLLLGHARHIYWFHANMSWLALRKLMSALFYLSFKLPPIKEVLDESSSCSLMALMPMSLGLAFTLDLLGL